MSTEPQNPMAPNAVHNVRFGHAQQASGTAREEFLTVEHVGRPEHTPDVEGVLLSVDDKNVTMTLEDGERFVFDATELRSALRDAA